MEPNLKNIDDYNHPLPKQKKRVIWAIIAVALALGILITYIQSITTDDEIQVEKSIKSIPYK